MTDVTSFFSGLLSANQSSHEQRLVSALLFSEDASVQLGDQRLNSIAALTYNSAQCDNIFQILEKSLIPENNPWQTLLKSVLLTHTIVLYGSEKAVDAAISTCPTIYKLREYNSALIRRSIFSQSRYDNGGPVRTAADALYSILMSDDGIRGARAEARDGQNTLVPMGFQPAANATPEFFFGQGVEKSVGAGFDLMAVPGMYEGRPDRYFDDDNDIRKGASTGDHQFTREALNKESLLDLVFDTPSADQSAALPAVEYLPALQRQQELEAQLAAQQEQLRRLQALAAAQGQAQSVPSGGPVSYPPPVPHQGQAYTPQGGMMGMSVQPQQQSIYGHNGGWMTGAQQQQVGMGGYDPAGRGGHGTTGSQPNMSQQQQQQQQQYPQNQLYHHG